MPNTEKVSAVAEISERLTNSSAAVITEYRGLSVKQVTDLRRALGNDTTYAVVKNTLTKLAATQAGVTIDDSLLVGPTAIAFVTGDPVVAAKGLRDFARTNPLLVIKGGLIDGKQLSAADVARIADLESREVLLARLAGVLKALPTRAAGLFQAPLTQLARLAKALEEKKAGETANEGVVGTDPVTDGSRATDTGVDTVADASVDSVADAAPAGAGTVPAAETAPSVAVGPAAEPAE
jgi:large subunit ribosomal protein L10